jgi:hypothetical protein
MLGLRQTLSALRHCHWYLGDHRHIPLSLDLDAYLPLPALTQTTILWPKSYAWPRGAWRIERVKRELCQLLPFELYDVPDSEFDWHTRGGFPVPEGKQTFIGRPGHPKGTHDLRGEIFAVRDKGNVVRCAYDYSDYPIISTEIAARVDLYFKEVAPLTLTSPKVIAAGYMPRNPRLVAKARVRYLAHASSKTIDVYGRFGNWTDSQPFRQMLVSKVATSSLNFVGGFDPKVYPVYLKELMRAKIALEAPGQAPLSQRLPEAMALGAVVATVDPKSRFPEELVEGIHYISIKDDGSDVVSVCEELLRDEERRERIAAQGMLFFDRNFSPQSVGRRIIHHAINLARTGSCQI